MCMLFFYSIVILENRGYQFHGVSRSSSLGSKLDTSFMVFPSPLVWRVSCGWRVEKIQGVGGVLE